MARQALPSSRLVARRRGKRNSDWSIPSQDQPACGARHSSPPNAHLREELDFGGDWTTQLGWLWRGESGSTLRTGLHYVNGKSTQYQFFDNSEEQIGIGLWYDF